MEPAGLTALAWLSGEESRALTAIVVGAGRYYGFMLVFPLFGWLGVGGVLKYALAAGLAIPLGLAGDWSQAPPLLGWTTIALLGKETLVGVALGAVFGLPVWAAQGAGDVLDSYRGALAENYLDPLNASEVSEFGRLNAVLAMAWMVASGSLGLIFESLSRSFDIFAPFSFGVFQRPELLAEIAPLLGRLCLAIVVFAGPPLVLLFLSELAVAAIGRAGKQVNVNDLSSLIKTTVCVLCLPVYGFFFFGFADEVFWANVRPMLSRTGVTP